MLWLVSVSGLFLLASCSSSQEQEKSSVAPVPVTVASPSLRNADGILFSGRVEAGQTANVSTRMMGTIDKIYVREGDRVRAGQLLVSISNRDVLAKKKQAEAMVAQAEAALQNAKKDEERFSTLYAQQSVSPKELENVTLQYRSAQAQYEVARQMLNEVEVSMGYTQLVAPFSGVVTQKMADEGSMANPGMPLLVVEQGGKFLVSATVSESDITHVRLNDRVSLMVKSTGRTFPGSIERISPSSQSTGGQYMVKITVPDSVQHALMSGMYVNAFIPLSVVRSDVQNEESFVVPESAIVYRDQLTGVYLFSDKQTAVLRWVRLGKVTGSEVEVLSGLSQGERFIVQADGKLYNGVPVMEKTSK